MNLRPLFVALLALLCLAGAPARALMIRDYTYNNGLTCDILWGPDTMPGSRAGGAIWADQGEPLDDYNGAWIAVEMFAGGLFIRTADSDTNGAYGPDATDWFSIAQPIWQPFRGTRCWVWQGHFTHYWIEPLLDTTWGLRLFAGHAPDIEPLPPIEVPDAPATLGLLAASLACLGSLRRRFAPARS